MRIATFNVFFGKDPEKIATAIFRNSNLSKADVILLQEIEAYPSEGSHRAQKIADILGMSCLYSPARDQKNGGTHGLAILTRVPVKEFEVVQLPRFNLNRKRIAVNAVLKDGDSEILISNVHLDNRLNLSDRLKQMQVVLDKIESHHVKKIVMAGDFNTIPLKLWNNFLPIGKSSQRKAFNSYLRRNGFDARVEEVGRTMRQRILPMTLDAIYVKGLYVEQYNTESSIKVSDHMPLWADVFEERRRKVRALGTQA